MLWTLAWLIAIELLALGALPLAVRLFRALPDHGYLFAKPLGMLVVAYLCWLLGVLGILRFERVTIAVVAVAVAAIAWGAWGRETLERLSLIRSAVLTLEILFLIFFAAATVIRAYNPEISGTEKPMDFALMNSIYRGGELPPEDPWLSGFSISYYYFGYLLLAMATKLAGIPASAGYNLGVALVFALLLAGSFSLAFNLISALRPGWRLRSQALGALAAPLLIGVMGNLEIGLEVLAARGVGDASFWSWVGVKGLQPAAQPQGWLPTSHWWWWRASRVVPTTKPDGINEFPYFSFLLGDLHPHYTVLPWALLAVAFSLAVLLKGKEWKDRDRGTEWDWLALLAPALSLGVLLVANSWDFPTYTALFWVASLVAAAQPSPRPVQSPGYSVQSDHRAEGPSVPPLSLREGRGEGQRWRRRLLPALKRPAAVSACSVLLYSPFFLGFASQTKGIGLSADKTPLSSMLIIFGPFFFLLACFLTWRAATDSTSVSSGLDRRVRWPLLGAAWLVIVSSWLLGSLSLLVGLLLLAAAAAHRLVGGNEVGLAEKSSRSSAERPSGEMAAQGFLLILATGGVLLILGPELVFLIDLFGTRMNTVFKFHYQAWLMLGLVSSVSAVWMMAASRSWVFRTLFVVGASLLVGVGLLYPLAATPSKAQDFRVQPTIDGAAFYQALRPDDYAAIQWLSQAASGRPVVLEATGGEYSEYARVSTFSGLPTVLGWGGHESQWGRRGEELQRRTQDIEAIYRTADPSAIRSLLDRYQVEYVFVGSLESEKYGAEVANRFEGLLELVHRQGRVAIYQVPRKGSGVGGRVSGNQVPFLTPGTGHLTPRSEG